MSQEGRWQDPAEKLLERILDGRNQERVEQELGEEQQGFRKGRGTTDGMFALGQLVEKRLEMQGRMTVRFVDLEKTYDTVPREIRGGSRI